LANGIFDVSGALLTFSTFLKELKRRRVYRVAALYLVVGWAVAGAADYLLDLAEAPDVVSQVVAILVMTGFPLALVFAWAYDLTPDGVMRTPSTSTRRAVPADETGPEREVDAARTTTALSPRTHHERDAPPPPSDKSLAVLPFDNMSGDHDQEYFSDGISEDLTSALSRFDWLFVVARNSAFTYKGTAVDLKRVGRELGVRYIVEGSVQRAGSRVRVNVQLIDAKSNRHLWAERFDREMEDVFELQDDIVARIAATLGPEITLAEIERTHGKRPETFNAWDHYLRATAAYHRMTKEDLETAISHLETAIEIEPEFANAYALLGTCYAHIGLHGWVRPARQAYEEARRLVEKAVRLAPSSSETNYALAFVLTHIGEAEQAVVVARRAIELNPNFAEAHAILGHALVFCGDLKGGLAACHQAERSSPRDSRGSWLYDTMGHAYFFLGDYEKAIEVSKRGVHQDPSLIGGLVTLACAYAQLGRDEEARHYVDELVRQIPRYSLRALRKNPMFVVPELIDKLVESMRMAGLPD